MLIYVNGDIMNQALMMMLIYLSTAISSNELNNYLERLNFKEFDDLFLDEEFSKSSADILSYEMSYNKAYNFLPYANIIIALYNWYHRKKKMEYIIDKGEFLLEDDRNREEKNAFLEQTHNPSGNYFVGYYEGEKPIVIWFTFNGKTIDIKDTYTRVFDNLSGEEIIDKVLTILNDIKNGVDGYIYSDNIYRVLNSRAVRNILMEYTMEKEETQLERIKDNN